MAFAKDIIAGVNGQQTYNISFGSLRSTHLSVTVNGTPPTVTYNSTRTQFTIVSPSIVGGETIIVQRTTPRTEAGQLTNFEDGSTLTEQALEDSRRQQLYISQEILDGLDTSLQKNNAETEWEGENLRLTDLANATLAQDAVTKAQLDSAVIAAGNLPSVSGADNDSMLVVTGGAWAVRTKTQTKVNLDIDDLENRPWILSYPIQTTLYTGAALSDNGARIIFTVASTTILRDPLGGVSVDEANDRLQLPAGHWAIIAHAELQNTSTAAVTEVSWSIANDADGGSYVAHFTDNNIDIPADAAASGSDAATFYEHTEVVYLNLVSPAAFTIRARNNTATGTPRIRVNLIVERIL